MMSAAQVLERLQLIAEPNAVPTADRYPDFLRSVRIARKREQQTYSVPKEELLERKRFARERLATGRPSRYEDPNWYQVLHGLFTEIAKTATAAGRAFSQVPVLGTLPFGRLNAMTIRAEAGDFAIVFQRELFNFVNLLSKIVSYALPLKEADHEATAVYTSNEAIERRLAEDDTCARRLHELLKAYLVAGDTLSAPQYFLADEWRPPAAALLASMELFVVGHEAAHILGGHFDGQLSTGAVPFSPEIDEVQWSWMQEFDADVLGLSLSMTNLRDNGIPPSASYWGADLFFTIDDIVSDVLLMWSFGGVGVASETHPASAERVKNLRRAIRPISDAAAGGPLYFAELADWILRRLWAEVRPHFASFRNSGGKLAPMWNLV